MVDIIKFLPPLSKPAPSDNRHIQSRSSSRQITLPILLSTITINSQHDRTINSNHKKTTVRRSPYDSHRQNHVSDTPNSQHRKIIDHAMARYYPGATIDMTASIKIKQQQQQQQQQLHKNSNKEQFKAIIGSGTTVTSIPVSTNVDARRSRLFDTLSKHFTIKAEPLRPVNNFVNNTTSTLYSWKKYWTSTKLYKQRDELYDSVHGLHDFQYDQTLLSTKDFVTVRDSSLYTNSGTFRRSSTSSTTTNISTPIQVSSPIIPEKQPLLINEESHLPIPQIISINENISSIDQSKFIEEDRLSSSGSNNMITNTDHELQERINKITTKIYKFPLPSNKLKVNKSIAKQTLLKPIEKQSNTTIKFLDKNESPISSPHTSITKRKRQKTADRKSSNTKANRSATRKQQFISTVTPTILKSKYERSKWDQPYVGVRKDPPTPPCSPLSVVNLENNDQDDNDDISKQESAKDVDL